jgi:hypothetical protein
VWEALLERFGEVFLEVSAVDIIVFVVAAEGLAPVPGKFFLVGIEAASGEGYGMRSPA